MSPLNDLQFAVLDILSWRVRASTDCQLAEKFETTAATIRRHMAVLEKRRAVASTTTGVQLLDLRTPLFCWSPYESPPDCEALAWLLAKRHKSSVRTIVKVYWATKVAVRLTGGVGGKLRQRLQLSHDLGTTDVFVRRRLESEMTWISEDVYRNGYQAEQSLRKVPDALLIDDLGLLARAIEIGGQYPSDRLNGLHQACANAALPYELW